jgi:TPR repeat protein
MDAMENLLPFHRRWNNYSAVNQFLANLDKLSAGQNHADGLKNHGHFLEHGTGASRDLA